MKTIARVLAIATIAFSGHAFSEPAKKTYNVCWSHYTGWEPWGLAEEKGILKKWADKNGIEIKLKRFDDYIESINLYTSGGFQACAMTNMDALTIPAIGGVDSTALIVGDFSNGNDGVIARKAKSMAEIKGSSVKVVELSVSHYLLSRALQMNGMTESDVMIVNASDAAIGGLFAKDPGGVTVTWNPILMKAMKTAGSTLLFDSSRIPGEIIDLMVVKSSAPDSLKKALAGAWYETMKLIEAGENRADSIRYMAKQSGTTVAEFEAQLKTTAMFFDPAKATEFVMGPKLAQTMEFVRTFSFDHGLYGRNAHSKNTVGIQFPDGSVLGDKKKIRLRFTEKYMKMAAAGQL